MYTIKKGIEPQYASTMVTVIDNCEKLPLFLGLDETIQRADVKPYGASYRVCPETTETQLNVMSCFEVNGTKDAAVAIQTVLPDLTNFQVLTEHTS